MPPSPESLTRKSRIDPKLDARGWRRVKAPSPSGACRTEEHPTAHGPADYALFLDGQPVAIVEAKKTAVDPQNVLTQAERYARGSLTVLTTSTGSACRSCTRPTASRFGSGTRAAR